MEAFDFYLDTKVTTWYRTPFEIEAESLEEARQKAIDYVKDDGHSTQSWEHIEDVMESITPGDNDGQPTEELFDNSTGNVIWDNTKIN